MKAIIFAGVGLFAAATIYGITDFAADKKKGTLDKLYKEETGAPVSENKTAVPAAAPAATASGTGNTVSVAKKNSVRKKVRKAPPEEVRFIKLEDFSRGRIEPRRAKPDAAAEAAKEIRPEEQ